MEGAACCLQRTEVVVWKTLCNGSVSGDVSTTTADRLAQSGWVQLSSRASRSNAASRREVGARRARIESVSQRRKKRVQYSNCVSNEKWARSGHRAVGNSSGIGRKERQKPRGNIVGNIR